MVKVKTHKRGGRVVKAHDRSVKSTDKVRQVKKGWKKMAVDQEGNDFDQMTTTKEAMAAVLGMPKPKKKNGKGKKS